jgi:DNA-binding transcriptional LysR family regulator
MNITSVNLNLLLAFEALLEEQSVSRAAARMNLSQPAMSSALGRLREVFNDPLLIKTGRRMKPTPRALELIGPVRSGLMQLRGALSDRPVFDPGQSTRSFQIAMTDYTELLLLGSLLQRMRRRAPKVQIFVRRLDRIFSPPENALRSGTFDAAIGFFPEAASLEPGVRSLDLSVEENVCIARKGNPLVGNRFTLRQFAKAAHLAVFYRAESQGMIDNVMAAHGLRRRLQATTPHFLSVPQIVAGSDLVAVVPAGLASIFQKTLQLEVRKVPLALPLLHTRLLWHEHADEEPAHRWLRREIKECFIKSGKQSSADVQKAQPRR